MMLRNPRREHPAELEEAKGRRAAADQNAEVAGNNLIDAWTTHCADLIQLSFETADAVEQLVAWTASPEGSNPMDDALAEAYARASVRHASRQSELEAERKGLQQERTTLIEEKDR